MTDTPLTVCPIAGCTTLGISDLPAHLLDEHGAAGSRALERIARDALAEVVRLRSLLADRDRRIELVQQHLAGLDSRTVHPDAIGLGLDLLPLLDGVLHPSHHTDTRES